MFYTCYISLCFFVCLFVVFGCILLLLCFTSDALKTDITDLFYVIFKVCCVLPVILPFVVVVVVLVVFYCSLLPLHFISDSRKTDIADL